MRIMTAVLLLALGAPAQAVNKCVDAQGRISYQAAPCPAGSAAHSVNVPAGATAPAPVGGADPGAQTEAVRQAADAAARTRRLKEIQGQIGRSRNTIDRLQADMDRELAALRRRQALAYNNLAGAMLEQSLATEMQAVVSKYDALMRVEQNTIARLQAEQQRLTAPP